ncbi:hypothetical protein SDC9_158672 [bioreactor metagenome]|uniref:Uncharacterized protein n=1 Tax=bioreactor metagenome TaxID=1076179 RepID=A0A645FAP3_9ZZZZ
MLHQQLVGHVDWRRAADIVHWPLNDVFTVFCHIQHAAVGQHRFHPGNRGGLNIRALHAQFRQRLTDRGVVGVCQAGKRSGQQGKQH